MKEFKSASKVSAAKKLAGVRKAYANGGSVSSPLGMMDEDMDPNDADDMPDGPMVDGIRTRQRLDRPQPKSAGRTVVNINVQSGSKPDVPAPAPIPPVVPPNVPPMAGPPPAPPMIDPSMMMQRKNGGRVPCGAGGGLGRLQKAKDYGLTPCKGK